MADCIGVLIADDSEQVRNSIKAMLDLEEGFVVVGEAPDGPTAVQLAQTLRPDVILMDINMPGLDGIAATGQIMRTAPTGIVIISVQGEADYLRRAMQAGARDYLIKPFTCQELVTGIRRAAAVPLLAAPEQSPRAARPKGKVMTLFSTKGGVGKSMLAANLAAGLGMKTRLKVAAVDLDLEFGILASLFGCKPSGTWLDLCRVPGAIEIAHVEKVMCRPSGLPGMGVLAAPPLPHQAAEVDGEGRQDHHRNYVGEVLNVLRDNYDYIVVDTSVSFRESILTALDRADQILLVAVPEVPALQNTAKALDTLLERLEYPREKVELVLNRAGAEGGLTAADVGKSLGQSVRYEIPMDAAAAMWSANAGQPIVVKRARTLLGDAVSTMAHELMGGEPQATQSAVTGVSGREVRPRMSAGGAPALAATGAGYPAPRRKIFGLF